MYLSSWDFPHKNICDLIRFVELSNRKKEWISSYLEDDAHGTVMLSCCYIHFRSAPLCSNVPVPARTHRQLRKSHKNNAIIESLIYIPYCLFLTLYTLTLLYMHILHTFLCLLTRRICSAIKSFFFVNNHFPYSHDLNV